MTYFLDANICIYHLNGSEPRISDRLEKIVTKDIKIPSMVAAELLFGANNSNRKETNIKLFKKFLSLYAIVPFDENAACHYAAIRADLEREGSPIGGNDLIIASIVLANGGVLVSHSRSEFSRIGGLTVEDWAE